jgi:hypothetical protein
MRSGWRMVRREILRRESRLGRRMKQSSPGLRDSTPPTRIYGLADLHPIHVWANFGAVGLTLAVNYLLQVLYRIALFIAFGKVGFLSLIAEVSRVKVESWRLR